MLNNPLGPIVTKLTTFNFSQDIEQDSAAYEALRRQRQQTEEELEAAAEKLKKQSRMQVAVKKILRYRKHCINLLTGALVMRFCSGSMKSKVQRWHSRS